MNAKQSLKKATAYIADLEDSNSRYRNDVKAYNAVIDCLIAGGSACGWCQDKEDCDRDKTRGCDEWMLAMSYGMPAEKIEMEVERDDDGGSQGNVPEDVSATGPVGGTGDQNAAGADRAL
jgi:hypothetical protein